MRGDELDLTTVVNAAGREQWGAVAGLMQERYEHLRDLARRITSRERPNATINPTALVHEAYLRLIDQTRVTERGTTFFRACFAQECRRVLVDHARGRKAVRRGGSVRRETIVDSSIDGKERGFDLLEVHEAIETLAQLNERMARIVDMRVFAGMTVPECAEALGVSARTVDKDWSFARTWLKKQLA